MNGQPLEQQRRDAFALESVVHGKADLRCRGGQRKIRRHSDDAGVSSHGAQCQKRQRLARILRIGEPIDELLTGFPDRKEAVPARFRGEIVEKRRERRSVTRAGPSDARTRPVAENQAGRVEIVGCWKRRRSCVHGADVGSTTCATPARDSGGILEVGASSRRETHRSKAHLPTDDAEYFESWRNIPHPFACWSSTTKR